MEINKPDIELIIRGEPWSVQLDVKLFPLQCPLCNTYFPDLFKHEGSRYGQVGTVVCKCGETIHLTDNDNIVEYIKIHSTHQKRVLNFKDLYHLNQEDFEIIKKRYNYDIFKEHLDENISLNQLVVEIKEKTGMNTHFFEADYPLPDSVKEWIGLLNKKK